MASNVLSNSRRGVNIAVKSGFGRSLLRTFRRNRSSSSVNGPLDPTIIAKTPLTEPLQGLPTPIYASPADEIKETKVTVLENGLRVASERRFGQFCTVGVLIDAGSRKEVGYLSGVSHFLDKLAFGATKSFASRDTIMQTMEKFGGICDSQNTRDVFIYASSANTRGLDEVVRILSETVWHPKITEEEMAAARDAIQYELQDLERRPEQDTTLTEMIHAAAYRSNTYGLPKVCPLDNIEKITTSHLYTFLSRHYTPSRMVLAGVGVEHDALVESASKYFGSEVQAIWAKGQEMEKEANWGKKLFVDESVPQYTGGEVRMARDLSQTQVLPSAIPEQAHFVLGLESCGHKDDPDFVPFCVLQMMMGGGSSFSAGGPGKGMYTRLYTRALNKYSWMYNAIAYNHAYADTGLFYIQGSCEPDHLSHLIEVIVYEMAQTAGEIKESELERAKKQLISVLLMNLESRPIVFEDVGRQVLTTGCRQQPEHFIYKISDVTKDDIKRVATRMMKSRPAIAILGVDSYARYCYDEIEEALVNNQGRLNNKKSGRFSLFFNK